MENVKFDYQGEVKTIDSAQIVSCRLEDPNPTMMISTRAALPRAVALGCSTASPLGVKATATTTTRTKSSSPKNLVRNEVGLIRTSAVCLTNTP